MAVVTKIYHKLFNNKSTLFLIRTNHFTKRIEVYHLRCKEKNLYHKKYISNFPKKYHVNIPNNPSVSRQITLKFGSYIAQTPVVHDVCNGEIRNTFLPSKNTLFKV